MSDDTAADPEIVTFGCRLNAYESEVMREHARAAGLKQVVIVNTCAVTSEAERQARQQIRKLRREHPEARIVVTGCAVQINPTKFADMPEIDQILGNEEKLKPESWGLEPAQRVLVNDIMTVRETAPHLIQGFEDRARAFIQVQQGCDHRCTFCIIPFGRGPSRSVPIAQVIEQVHALVKAGYKEVVLSGVDITSYGPDLPGEPALGQMVKRLLAAVPDLPRLRLSSLDPVETDPDLWRLIENEPRLLPHLHLSLQAGDDMILKRMKRRHSRADAVEFCRRARAARPDIVFGADLIAGFPTETDEMFDNTLRLVEDCGLTWLHVFPYSPRPGTPAARMPQVHGTIRRARAQTLREAGEAALAATLAGMFGRSAQVLVEKENLGRTEHFAEIRLDRDLPPGSLVRATITGAANGELVGMVSS
jgi:threonylcarbamoyladenosine tRNA methylthiotransferase MtaB